jgi:salicylate hydroxylase
MLFRFPSLINSTEVFFLTQMLPFGSQGANQAIEDAGALGLLLATVKDPAEMQRRLELFEKLRLRRASRVQILSSVRVGRENFVEDKIKPYLEDGMPCKSTFSSAILSRSL